MTVGIGLMGPPVGIGFTMVPVASISATCCGSIIVAVFFANGKSSRTTVAHPAS